MLYCIDILHSVVSVHRIIIKRKDLSKTMADKVKEPVKTEKRWFGIFLAAVSPLMYEL